MAARWALHPDIFSFLRRVAPDSSGEITLTDAIRLLCRENRSFWGVPLQQNEARQDIAEHPEVASALQFDSISRSQHLNNHGLYREAYNAGGGI